MGNKTYRCQNKNARLYLEKIVSNIKLIFFIIMRLLIYLIIITTSNVFSQELVLGEERIEPGIVIFEGYC